MNRLSISEILNGFEEGHFSSREVVSEYLERIRTLDKAGPELNSVIELNPEAVEAAALLDLERENGRIRGPLHGIPVMVKDNINTGDRMMTTAGSLALEGNYASEDAPLVRNLRKAGAVILGKTNLSEWANFRSLRSTSGWSSRGGQTKNPYDLLRNPCGSSSGSAAAVAANLCSAAIGTETDGSIVCPAQTNGIVGIKPGTGLIDQGGIIPISASQDTAGPMTRTVTDAEILLEVMSGGRFKSGELERPAASFRIGVARSFFGYHPGADNIAEKAVEIFSRLGVKILDPVALEWPGSCEEAELTVLLYEFKTGLNRYLSTLDPKLPVHSLEELIRYNEENSIRILPHFGQEILLMAEEKGSLGENEYKKAREVSLEKAGREGIDSVCLENRLDALIAPTGAPAWLTDYITGDHHLGACSSPAAVAGYPHITVPGGMVSGLPVGVSIFSTRESENVIIWLAALFEAHNGFIPPPPLFNR